MANAFSNTTTWALFVQTAYDKSVEFALRTQPLFRAFADKHPTDVDKPGSTITLSLYNDLSVGTPTALTEAVDPDSVALPAPSQVSVTLQEWGNAVLLTKLIEAVAFTNIDPAVANIVAYNMANTLDVVARTAFVGGTNVLYENATVMTAAGSRGAVAATDIIKSRDIRYITAKLRTNAAPTRNGSGFYLGLVHPEVSYDLRTESGAAAWRDPHVYAENANDQIWSGEIGAYEGVRFIETPRNLQANDGAASAKVQRSLFFGDQAFVEAVNIEPHTVLGPITDKLNRFRPLGWHALLGYSVYRQASLFRLETSSSI